MLNTLWCDIQSSEYDIHFLEQRLNIEVKWFKQQKPFAVYLEAEQIAPRQSKQSDYRALEELSIVHRLPWKQAPTALL